MSDLIGSLDRAAGGGLERLVCRHHRRRLRRIGWEGALNPGAGMTARADPPARTGGVLRVLEAPIRRTDQGGYGSFGAPTVLAEAPWTGM